MTLRDTSKGQYESPAQPLLEHLNSGSLQRIADACERMATNVTALIAERDRFKAALEAERHICRSRDERIAHLERRIASLRGVITMKRKGTK